MTPPSKPKECQMTDTLPEGPPLDPDNPPPPPLRLTRTAMRKTSKKTGAPMNPKSRPPAPTKPPKRTSR